MHIFKYKSEAVDYFALLVFDGCEFGDFGAILEGFGSWGVVGELVEGVEVVENVLVGGSEAMRIKL
jgi:hypothetical protein